MCVLKRAADVLFTYTYGSVSPANRFISDYYTHTQSENIKASGVCKIDHGCLCLLPVAALKSVELVTIQLNEAKKGQELRVRLYNSLSGVSALFNPCFP